MVIEFILDLQGESGGSPNLNTSKLMNLKSLKRNYKEFSNICKKIEDECMKNPLEIW